METAAIALILAIFFSQGQGFVLPGSPPGAATAMEAAASGSGSGLTDQSAAGLVTATSGDEDDYEGNNLSDWEETRKMLLEYLDQGGNAWEIPEVPRLIMISELGLQESTPSRPSQVEHPVPNQPMSDAPYYAEPVHSPATQHYRAIARYVSSRKYDSRSGHILISYGSTLYC